MFDWSVWLWPLPPPGRLAFVVQWSAEDIAEKRHEIDANAILEAAERAEVLWSDGGAQESRALTARFDP